MINSYMLITYWNTLYNQSSSMRCIGQITFSDDGIHFTSGGHRYCISYENVIKIEHIEDAY